VRWFAFVAALVAAIASPAAIAQTPLRVIAFDGGWNLPVWAAQRQGLFETNGVSVQLSYTPTSGFLITSLLDGKVDLALALMDNVVAYQEGQGEAKIPENPDLFAFLGGDGGEDLRRPQG
jgi:ABC-type nitrate/sulfonate/bicarbonate transport system substrate-binding protein